MSELERRASMTPQTRGPDSASASTARTDFTRAYIGWEDLPGNVHHAVNSLTGPLAAEGVEADQGVKHRNGAYWQPWTAWRATRDGLVVLDLRRELRRGDGKRFSPTGTITVHTVRSFSCAEPPMRRHGTVDQGTTAGHGHTSGGGALPTVQWWDYLPAEVRNEILTSIPTPTFEQGTVVQWSDGDQRPTRQQLTGIKLDEQTLSAVVVTATRALDHVPADRVSAATMLAGLPWVTTRYRYRLQAQNQGLDATHTPGLER